MENYKEKYERALETIQEILSSGSDSIMMPRLKLRLQSVFPELKVSEDEKIRKELIAWLKNSEGQTLPIDRYHAALAWLEKQGNSSVKWQKNTPENKPPKNHSVLMKTVDGIAEGEWDGKYWHQYRWSTHIYDSNVLYWMELHDLDEQGEQKPVDKVEPLDKYEGLTDFERTLADICIGWIGEELGWKQYIKDNADVLIKIAIKKFNSIQDAPFEQKPAAWSKEDEHRVEDTIYFLDTAKKHYASTIELDACIDWLKSLKDRIGG